MIINLTQADWNKEVVDSEIPVLVEFWAPWCGHCTSLAPTIEEIAKDYDGQIKVCMVNIDEEPALTANCGVMSIPACIRYENGDKKWKTLGAYSKADLLSQLGFNVK